MEFELDHEAQPGLRIGHVSVREYQSAPAQAYTEGRSEALRGEQFSPILGGVDWRYQAERLFAAAGLGAPRWQGKPGLPAILRILPEDLEHLELEAFRLQRANWVDPMECCEEHSMNLFAMAKSREGGGEGGS